MVGIRMLNAPTFRPTQTSLISPDEWENMRVIYLSTPLKFNHQVKYKVETSIGSFGQNRLVAEATIRRLKDSHRECRLLEQLSRPSGRHGATDIFFPNMSQKLMLDI
jgi:hypothetical protein